MKIQLLSLKTIVFFVSLIIAPSIYAEGEVDKPAKPTPTQTTVQKNPAPVLVAVSEILVGPGGTKQELLALRNDTATAMPVSLTAVVSSANNTTPRIKFKGQEETGEGEAVYSGSIPANGVVKVWALITDVTSPGEFEADLKNKDQSIGKIKVIRLPFAVKLDETNPEKFSLVDGEVTSIALKNDDPVSYPLLWRLSIDGEETCGGKFTLAASGPGVIKCKASLPLVGSECSYWVLCPVYLSRVQDFIKGQEGKGTLLLYPDSPHADIASPWKTIPIAQASMSWVTPFTRQIASYFLIIFVLILGGLVSLVLSQALPNRLLTLNVREQLDDIWRTIGDFSSHVDSKLQVMLKMERIRLVRLLKSRSPISPDFAGIAKQCSDATGKLGLRVGLAQQMDVVLGRLARARSQAAPPSLMFAVEASLEKAKLLLSKGQPIDADLTAAQAAIVEAAAVVDTLMNPDWAFGEKLKKRAREVKVDIEKNYKNKSATFKALNEELPGPFDALERVRDEEEISPDRYTAVDMAIQKILLMKEYVQMFEATAHAPRRGRLEKHKDDLIEFLQLGSWEALRLARLLVREMRDDIYPKRIYEALRDKEAVIDMDPDVAYEHSLLEFCICFQNGQVNCAAAHEELICSWDFGDGLTGTGWNVSHFFKLRADDRSAPIVADGDNSSTQIVADGNKANETAIGNAKTKGAASKTNYTVRATFINAKGEVLVLDETTKTPVELSKVVEVSSRAPNLLGERAWTEGLKLGAALLIAVIGLIAGAQEQLLKLDILPGLIAVFLVGFGADTIKNLLTTKS